MGKSHARERKYDIVLFLSAPPNANGTWKAGDEGQDRVEMAKLAGEYIFDSVFEDVRLAVAGPEDSRPVLQETVTHLVEHQAGKERRTKPVSEVCKIGKGSLEALAKSSKVIINCESHNILTGEAIIEACIGQHTHYVDASEDTIWLAAMISKHESRGKENNTTLLNVSSAPQDLLSLVAIDLLRTKLSLKTKEMLLSVPKSNSPPSAVRKTSTATGDSRPFHLCPTAGHYVSDSTNLLGVRKELTLGLLEASHTEEAKRNQAFVYRSWGLLSSSQRLPIQEMSSSADAVEIDEAGYATKFCYNEYHPISSNLSVLQRKVGFSRACLGCCGPRKDKSKDTNWKLTTFAERWSTHDSTCGLKMRCIAIADVEGPYPDRAVAELGFHGSRERLRAICLVQGAAILLFGEGSSITPKHTKNSRKVGFVTPAVLGTEFVERLIISGVEIEGVLV